MILQRTATTWPYRPNRGFGCAGTETTREAADIAAYRSKSRFAIPVQGRAYRDHWWWVSSIPSPTDASSSEMCSSKSWLIVGVRMVRAAPKRTLDSGAELPDYEDTPHLGGAATH